MKRIGIVTFLAVQLVAQNPVVRQGTSPSGDVDFSGARTTKPVRTGGTLPGACVANELFFLTNVGLQQCVKGKFSAVGNGGTWGTVSGAIAAQTDLWNTLQTKQPVLKGAPSQYVRGDGSMGSLEGTYEPVDAGILRSGSTYVNPSWTKFRSGGMEAVSRTVDSKLSDVTSVKDYGAVADGAANDTASIQAAHNAVCAAGGGDLLYPAGTYLISPVAGSNVGTFRICSNMHVTLAAGARVLVKPNAGDYWALYYPATGSTQVDNFSISGPGTIDQNAYNNTTATIISGSSSASQLIVCVFKGTNFRANGLRLFISGVNSIDANGTAVSGIDISNNHFTFQKRTGQPPFDNSAIYINGTNWHVATNTFDSTLADSATTAIEIHKGIGNVSGNTTEMYVNGMNIVDTTGATISGNTNNNAGNCIQLWAVVALSNTVVSNNVCSINNVDRLSTENSGIGTNYSGESLGPHSNLSINNNVITFQRDTVARTVSYGSIAGISLRCNCTTITNAIVKDNLIVNVPVRAITMAAGTLMSNVTVQNNTIVDPGSNLSPLANAYSAGISYGGNGTDVAIINNTIRFTMNPFVGLNSLYIQGTAFLLTRVYAYGNLVTAVNGTPGSYYDPQVIKNSPLIAKVASTGSYGDLLNKPTMASTTAILMGDGLGGAVASPIADNGSTLAVSGRTLTVGSTLLEANGAISNPAGPVAIAAGGTNQNVTITPSGTGNTVLNGNVGIGTATPVNALQIGPQIGVIVNTPLSIAGAVGVINLQSTSSSNWSGFNLSDHVGNLVASLSFGNSGAPQFANQLFIGARKAGVPIIFSANNGAGDHEAMRIIGNGNIGIGVVPTTTPLEVNGAIKATSLALATPLPPANGGVGGMINVPPQLRFLGDGSDGAITCSGNLFGVKYATTFAVNVGSTCTVNASTYALVVHATGACTIAGTLNARGVDGGNALLSDGGGTGGGGGGGAAAGALGSAASLGGSFVAVNGGSAGPLGGGAGGNGSPLGTTWQRATYEYSHGSYVGGAKGGAGGSTGAAGGNGGQGVILMCGSINFTGTIDASGAVGASSTGNSVGAGGGGGGGYVWLLGRDSVVNSGTIAVAGGAGGSCGAFTTCGTGGVGGAGWSKVAVMQ